MKFISNLLIFKQSNSFLNKNNILETIQSGIWTDYTTETTHSKTIILMVSVLVVMDLLWNYHILWLSVQYNTAALTPSTFFHFLFYKWHPVIHLCTINQCVSKKCPKMRQKSFFVAYRGQNRSIIDKSGFSCSPDQITL